MHIFHNILIPLQRKNNRYWQLILTYLDGTMGPAEATCHIFSQSFYVLMPIREGQRKIVLKLNCSFFAPSAPPILRHNSTSWQLILTYLDGTMGPSEATCPIFSHSFNVLMPIREGQRKIVLKLNCIFFSHLD